MTQDDSDDDLMIGGGPGDRMLQSFHHGMRSQTTQGNDKEIKRLQNEIVKLEKEKAELKKKQEKEMDEKIKMQKRISEELDKACKLQE